MRPSAGPAAAGGLPEPGRVIGEKYRIEQLIAQGGMGAVYAATHVVSGKRVALKWMLPMLGLVPGASERFVREARATARIDHPNVVDIYDVGTDQGSVYLVMEFLRGETLLERMTRAPLTPRTAIALLMPALRGVAAAHAQGVIHRDLKPDNIFLCQGSDGDLREPKVLDFGISKIAQGDELRDPALTQSGMVMGTPYYMSPEQVRGAGQVDARSDVYAFGVILYEMLTNRRPFEAETYNQLIFKIATEDPPPILTLNPYVDKALVAVVERAMARDPAQRLQTVEALALALEPYAGGATFRLSSSIPGELEAAIAARDTGGTQRAKAGLPAWPWIALALAALAAGAIAWQLQRKPVSATSEPSPVAGPEHVVQPRAVVEPAAPAVVPAAPPAAAAPPAQPVTAAPPAAPARDSRESEAKHTRERESSRHAARAKAAEANPSAPAETKPAGLPADWDDRVRAAPAAGPAPSAAGRINASDLR